MESAARAPNGRNRPARDRPVVGARPPAPSFAEFLRVLEAEATAADFKVVSVGPTSLSYDFRGIKGELFYESLWRDYVGAAPGDRDDLVKWHIRHRALTMQTLAPDSFASARKRLLPRIVSWEWGRGTQADGRVPLWPLVEGHLQIGLVIDTQNAVRYITTDEITAWKKPFPELYAVAEENLVARSDVRLVERFSGNVQLRYYQSNDGHDAARALVLRHLMQPFPSAGMVFVVPARDFIAFAPVRGGESLELVHHLIERAQPVYANEPGPLSVNAFWFDGEAYEVITAEYGPRGRGLVFSDRFLDALSALPHPQPIRR